ncbi:MAG: hypothetical protein VX768_15485 [Planctomycetota bacterium]|nr:hypothetical protein [Planctomycetota bacterium]
MLQVSCGTGNGQLTSLTDASVKFSRSRQHWARLSNPIATAIIVDNEAVDTPELPDHRSGYSGVASLVHQKQKRSLFVPGIAGLNFEHIHDGTTAGLVEKFEPRKFPMELRIINQTTVELYQPPTGNWKLESCGRYELLKDGTLEYRFECIPRAVDFRNDFIGLFWASYIEQPEDNSIFFRGRKIGRSDPARWIRGVSPRHGVSSTHRPAGAATPRVDSDFPLTLVNHPSQFEVTEPWYFGVCRNMAVVQMFRPQDQIWIAQSPSGGGQGNPAWDFQWFIRKPKVGQSYGFVMRMAYFPYQGRKQLIQQTEVHRAFLKNN